VDSVALEPSGWFSHIKQVLGLIMPLVLAALPSAGVDVEADPNYDFSSLVQLERFARIDLGTRIVLDWPPIGERSRRASKSFAVGEQSSQAGPHVAIGVIDYPPALQTGPREQGVLVYIKSSMSGDENDYVVDYKRRNPDFPQESTLEQVFSEEQLEAYRALGEHIGRRFCRGEDEATIALSHGRSLMAQAMQMVPNIRPALDTDCCGRGLKSAQIPVDSTHSPRAEDSFEPDGR
jgi:hypothetical protein